MIHESAPWKDRLAKDAALVARWASKTRHSERRSVLIEQKVFLAAYVMRKLLEAGKLSSSFDGLALQIDAIPLRPGKRVDRHSRYDLPGLYDFDRTTRKNVAAPVLLDLIIHSLIFAEVAREDDSIEGFFVTSDRKSSALWMVEIDRFIALMRSVANDYPSSVRFVRNAETGESAEWRGAGEPPAQIGAKMNRIARSNRKA